jgi:MipA family protein
MLLAATRRVCVVLILLAATAGGAAAQDAPPDAGPPGPPSGPPSWSWGVLVAGITQQQPYTGIKRFNFAIPLVYFENRWVQLMGPRLDVTPPPLTWGAGTDRELKVGLGVNLFGFGGYKASDAPILNGMENRKQGIFMGPFAKWSNPFVNVTAEWMLDASRNSEGQRFAIGVERTFGPIAQRLMFTPSLAVASLDKKYTDYYYGVRSAEARPDRPAYVAERTATTELGLRIDYMFSQKQAVFGSLQYTGLGSEIKNSPLVDRSGETFVLVGYLFRFR